MKKKGLGLGELFATLLIVGVLGTLLAIGYKKKTTDKNRELCLVNIKAISKVIELYRTEGGRIDFPTGLGRFKERHTDALKVYFNKEKFPECPDDGTYIINDFGELTCSKHKDHAISVKDVEIAEPKKITKIIETTKPEKMAVMSEDEKMFQKADKLFKEKKFSQAGYFYENAYKLNPKNEHYLYHASDSYFMAKEFSKARMVLSPILKRPKAQELAQKIKKYEYFKVRLNSYEGTHRLFYSLKTFGHDETINRINLLGRNEQILKNGLYLTESLLYQTNREKQYFYSSHNRIYRLDLETFDSKQVYDNGGLPLTGVRYSREKILFLSPKVNNNLQLVMLTISNRVAIGLTPENQNVSRAEFSTNGYYIYYLTGKKFYKYNIETGDLSVCWENPEIPIISDFVLHPKQEKVCAVVSGLNGSRKQDLILIDLETPEDYRTITVTHDIDEMLPTFSPKGNLLAFIRRDKEVEDLYAYDLNNMSTFALTSFKTDEQSFFPSLCWYPDEQFLYFSYGHSNTHALHILEISTRKHLKLLEKGSDIGELRLDYPITPRKRKSKDLKLIH